MQNPHPSFSVRSLASVLTGFAFLFLAASGTVLFLAPPGRIANWTNWTILGLRKSDWGGLHIWFSAVFLVAATVHLALNLRPLVGYFRDRVTRRLAFRREWVMGVGLCAAVAIGTLTKVAPFSSLLAWNERVKESWDRPAERAPMPHAERLTLAALVDKAGVDLPTATARLAAHGITSVATDTVVQNLAEATHRSAQEIYSLLVTPTGGATPPAGAAGGGLGWKSLAQFCVEEGISLPTALKRLETHGIKASADLSLREIATASGSRKPYELVELIRGR